jgi:hypothetical protein
MSTQRTLPYSTFVDSCPPHTQHDVHLDLSLIQRDVALGVSLQWANATDSTWSHWLDFCTSLKIDPTLQTTNDPILPLQLYTHHYRWGQISPSRTAVRGRTVGDAVRAIGQMLSNMGYTDPRLLPSGKLNFCLSRQLTAYTKQDSPPSRVKPILTSVLLCSITILRLSNHPQATALADMLTLGFYFLLRPGEYTLTSNPESSPFRLQDIHLHIGNMHLPHLTCSLHQLRSATFVCLEFTTQKNGVRGELIGLGKSGNPAFCPVQACINRVEHLQTYSALPMTPLYAFFHNGWQGITTTVLTAELRNTVQTMGHTVGLTPDDVSVRSLRASGAMALLCAHVDTDKIRLLGCWWSDEMLRYLHVHAYPVVAQLAPAITTAILLSFKTSNSLNLAYRWTWGEIGACSTLEWLQILGVQGQPQPKLVTRL